MKKLSLPALGLFVFLISQGAYAQQELNLKQDEPLEITADGTLEWKRDEKVFVAQKNAIAKQGESQVEASTLIANYVEEEGGGMKIREVTAEDNVIIRSRDSAAYGQKAVYDLDKGFAVMTGDNLKMTSPDQVVTATDKFEYWVTEGRLNAVGKAKATRLEDTLEADTISAVLKNNEKGERVLDTLEAKDNVVITTPTEVVTGKYGIYRAATNKAELTGGVTIKRGPNILEGARAEVDLGTNTSRLFGATGEGPGKQVRGVFFPGSEKKPAEKAP